LARCVGIGYGDGLGYASVRVPKGCLFKGLESWLAAALPEDHSFEFMPGAG
jgi:hypothetical protein